MSKNVDLSFSRSVLILVVMTVKMENKNVGVQVFDFHREIETTRLVKR